MSAFSTVPHLFAFILVACGDPSPCGWKSEEPDPTPADRNVLVVVLDDVGADQLASFGAEGEVAPTPTIDCLCDHGVRFERAWAAPICSAGRAALQTGRLADRTGIAYNVASDAALPDEEVTLAEAVGPAGYAAGVVGKWHLAGWHRDDSLRHPLDQGYDFFWGTPGNLQGGQQPDAPGDGSLSYDSWWQSINGDLEWTESYATTRTTDDALEFVGRNEPPWILVVAYHSPHKPIHVPPDSLITQSVADDAPVIAKYRAMVEATDTEIGRLLRSIDRDVLANTTVVLTSDNGTSPPGAVATEEDFIKSSLYEGGIHVPLVVAGAGVGSPGAASRALVHLVDLLPTFAGWADVAPPGDLDGIDLSPFVDDPDHPGPENVRTRWSPPDSEAPMDDAVRDDRYKLAIDSGVERLHDLEVDPDERTNLLDEPLSPDAAEAYDRLLAALAAPTAEGRWGAE